MYAFDGVCLMFFCKKYEFIRVYRKKVVSLQTKRIINDEECGIISNLTATYIEDYGDT